MAPASPLQRGGRRAQRTAALRTLVVALHVLLSAALPVGVRIPGYNAHIPPPPPTPAVSVEATPATPSASERQGSGMCSGGVWKEAPNAALETGAALPSVRLVMLAFRSKAATLRGATPNALQCWRKPTCARWNFATADRCKTLPNDEDWPTSDPHLPSNPPGQHSMKELLDTHWKDKTVVFVGDSINSLVYHAAVCEAAKIYNVAVGGHGFTRKDTSALSIHARSKELYQKLNELNVKHAQAGGTLWLPRPPQLPLAIEESRTMFMLKGWHMWKESDMQATMELADVIIVNYGLHYLANVSEHDEMMPLMFKQLDEFASRPGKAVLFRETGAEHKNVDENTAMGGFLESEVGHPDPEKVRGCQCTQRAGSDPELAVRLNSFVHDVAVAHPHVGVLPFYNLTKPRYDLHEAGFCAFEGLRGKKPDDPPPYCCDCTHYCYTPQLWKTFFHGVFVAHERVAASH